MNHLYYAKLQLLKLMQELLQLTFFFLFFLVIIKPFSIKIWSSAPLSQIPVFQLVDWFIS